MDAYEELFQAAAQVVNLVNEANKELDDALPGKIAEIVKTHAALAVGSSFIPIPGVDVAAGAAVIWGMYVRINSELKMPFQDNVIKSVASGVGANLTAYVGILAVGSALKFIPGLGTLTAIALMAAASYALTLASGYVYLKALTMLLGEKRAVDISEPDWPWAIDRVMREQDIQSFMDEARKSYKK